MAGLSLLRLQLSFESHIGDTFVSSCKTARDPHFLYRIMAIARQFDVWQVLCCHQGGQQKASISFADC